MPFNLDSDADDPDIDGNFNLIWEFSDCADNYSVYVHNDTITTINESITLIEDCTTELTYSISGLCNGTYYYAIVAHNELGNLTSNCINISVKLYTPTYFVLSSDADSPDKDGSFNLFWENSSYATNYTVYSDNDVIIKIDDNTNIIAEGVMELSYFISSLFSGDYYFLVVAFNEFGNYSSNCLYIYVQIPPSPFLLSTNADNPDTDGCFYLNWTRSNGANNYSIYTHNKYFSNIDDTITLVKDGIKTFNYFISDLLNGDFYYMIVSYNETGYTYSNCIYIYVFLPPYPFNLTTNADNPDIDGIFNLNWEISIGADNYSVYVYDGIITQINSSVNLLDDGITKLTYSIQGYNNGDYYFVIVAFNSVGTRFSNCIYIRVGNIESEALGSIAGFNIFILISIISAIYFLIMRRHIKTIKKRQ